MRIECHYAGKFALRYSGGLLERFSGIKDAVEGVSDVFTFRRELVAEAERYELSHGSHSTHSSSIIQDD